jgi:hypothetical protein
MGCDSIDGSSASKFGNVYIPRVPLLGDMRQIDRSPVCQQIACSCPRRRVRARGGHGSPCPSPPPPTHGHAEKVVFGLSLALEEALVNAITVWSAPPARESSPLVVSGKLLRDRLASHGFALLSGASGAKASFRAKSPNSYTARVVGYRPIGGPGLSSQ